MGRDSQTDNQIKHMLYTYLKPGEYLVQVSTSQHMTKCGKRGLFQKVD